LGYGLRCWLPSTGLATSPGNWQPGNCPSGVYYCLFTVQYIASPLWPLLWLLAASGTSWQAGSWQAAMYYCTPLRVYALYAPAGQLYVSTGLPSTDEQFDISRPRGAVIIRRQTGRQGIQRNMHWKEKNYQARRPVLPWRWC